MSETLLRVSGLKTYFIPPPARPGACPLPRAAAGCTFSAASGARPDRIADTMKLAIVSIEDKAVRHS